MAANVGAFAALDETGYRAVYGTKDAHQLSLYLRRLVAYIGGVVTDDDGLLSYAHTLLDGVPREKKFDEIVADFSHLPFATMISVNNPEDDDSRGSKRSQHPDKCPDGGTPKKVRGSDSAGNHTFAEGSSSSVPQGKSVSSSTAAERNAPLPSALEEIRMDGYQFCSEPFENLGAMVVTAPPWSPYHIVSARIFSLVLINPLDHTRGIVLAQHEDQAVVSGAGNGIVNEMGGVENSSQVLSSPQVYESLRADSTLISLLFAGPDHLSSLSAMAGASTERPAPSAPPAWEMVDATDAAGSAQSGNSDGSAETSGSTGHVHDAAPEEANDVSDCPICFEQIQPDDAAMRCAGTGGHHHYFHAGCLQGWIRSQRGRAQTATCPICRGRLQFNRSRLQAFLSNESESTTLSNDERTFLQSISDGLTGSNNWEDMTALERVGYTGGILAAAAGGFMVSYSDNVQTNPYFMADAWNMLPADHRIAATVGWFGGIVARIVAANNQSKKRGGGRNDDSD